VLQIEFMKLLTILFIVATTALVGCVLPTHKVSLSNTSEVYSGVLKFDSGYTGELSIPKGPEGESFSGRYVATDMSASAQAVGASATGQIDAQGVWAGRGSRGSTMHATVKVGRGGHGIGTAKHSNGKEYQISF